MAIVLPDTPTISLAQAAVILGVSRSTATRMADAGEIPTVPMSMRSRRVLTEAFLTKFGLAPAK